MIFRSFLALVLMLLAVAPVAAFAADQCQAIHGQYQHWNGWPPFERITAPDGKMYGLISSFEPDGDLQPPQYPLPDSLQEVWNANEDVKGEFQFCLDSDAKKFKDSMREPMELGWIKSFTPENHSAEAEFIRQIKITAIAAANTSPTDVRYRRLDVSFDYLDGVIVNAKIEKSNDKDIDDSAVLAAIRQAKYPTEPSAFRGKELHVELPLYLGVGD